MRYRRHQPAVAFAALLACLSAHPAQAGPGRPKSPKPVPAVRQAIVQIESGFVITPLLQPIAPEPPPKPDLVPIGGAVRIDRGLIEDNATGKVTDDAQI